MANTSPWHVEASLRTPLSVCVITLNEERHLSRCLGSVPWAAERLVVDCGSTDGTVSLARALGARVILHPWQGYAGQKQFAMEQARHDWVLVLDADECLDERLAQTIRALLEQPMDSGTAYELRRMSWFIDRFMRYGGWNPDWQLRLFDRRRARWPQVLVHERVQVDARIQRLEGWLLHRPCADLAEYWRKCNHYTTLAARQKAALGEKGSLVKAVTHSVAAFLRTYLLQRGFLEGATGLVFSVMDAAYVFIKYAKLWEMTRHAPARTPTPAALTPPPATANRPTV